MIRYNYSLVIVITLLLFSQACNPKQKDEAATKEGKVNGSIHVTKQQFEAEKMKLGEVTEKSFEQSIRCVGYIMAPATGIAQLNSLISGTIEKIYFIEGQQVKKGEVLFTLISNELIEIQQNYIEIGSQLKQSQKEYERTKALYEENIAAEKEFLAVESSYKIMQAKHKALKLQLSLLGLDLNKIVEGELYAKYPVLAPIDGFITEVNVVLGQFVEKQVKLIEVVNQSQLQLQLQVYEEDAKLLKEGQKVRFRYAGEETYQNEASVILIGKSIDPNSRTLNCIAAIQSKTNTPLVNRSFVEAEIVTSKQNLIALPNTAILNAGNEKFIFIAIADSEGYSLNKIHVETGQISKSHTEVKNQNELKNVLVNGAYHLSFE